MDVWASGILLFTILFGTQPFKAASEPELFRKILRGVLNMPKSSHPSLSKNGPRRCET